MTDFLLRLVESARGAPAGPRADVLDTPLEIDEEIEAPPLSAVPPATVARAPQVGETEPASEPPRHRSERTPPRPARSEVPHRTTRASPAPALPTPAPAPPRPVPTAPSPPSRDRPSTPAREATSPLEAAVARPPDTPPAAPPSRRAQARPRPAAAAGTVRTAAAPSAAVEPPRHLAAIAPPVAPVEQVVRVSIGRIEVRAAPAAAPPAAAVALARPRLSLDDYLAARDRAGR